MGEEIERMRKKAQKVLDRARREEERRSRRTVSKHLRLEIVALTALQLKAEKEGIPASKLARQLLGPHIAPYVGKAKKLIREQKLVDEDISLDNDADYQMMNHEHEKETDQVHHILP